MYVQLYYYIRQVFFSTILIIIIIIYNTETDGRSVKKFLQKFLQRFLTARNAQKSISIVALP